MNVSVTNFNGALSNSSLRSLLLNGDDVLDARVRVGGIAKPVMLDGGLGNDTIYGGAGADSLFGGHGDDSIVGGGGNDRFFGGTENDVLRGGSGADRLAGEEGSDTVNGGSNADILYGGLGDDLLSGGKGTDIAVLDAALALLEITRTASGFTIVSSDGTDTLLGIERLATDTGIYSTSESWNKISNTTGIELVNPGAVQTGTGGNDTLTAPGGVSSAFLKGLNGNDTLDGTGAQAVLVHGGNGDDLINATNGRLYGDGGNDTISGGGVLNGGDGSDHIIGSFTDDAMSGGAGADTFSFSFSYFRDPRSGQITGSIPWGNDTIADFQVGTDRLHFDYNLAGSTNVPELTLTLTADGYLVTLNLDSESRSSILLSGVDTPGLTLADILG